MRPVSSHAAAAIASEIAIAVDQTRKAVMGFIKVGRTLAAAGKPVKPTLRLTSQQGQPSLARMPNIRDVVQALGGREGVDGVILLGHDGLTIDSFVSEDLDSDGVSALVPSVIDSCSRFGADSGRGQFVTGVFEYSSGFAIVTQLTPEALLAVLVRPGINVGSLLYDLRRHRAAIAELL